MWPSGGKGGTIALMLSKNLILVPTLDLDSMEWVQWSANALQSSALVLCYSVAEYCTPVWSCPTHTSQVDVQLNSIMCLMSGTLRSTPLPWLPVLSNIELPALQMKAATDKLVEKIVKDDSWPIQPDILHPPLLHDWHPGSRAARLATSWHQKSMEE